MFFDTEIRLLLIIIMIIIYSVYSWYIYSVFSFVLTINKLLMNLKRNLTMIKADKTTKNMSKRISNR